MKERYLSKTPFLTFVYLSKCNINLPGYFGNSKKRFLWTGLLLILVNRRRQVCHWLFVCIKRNSNVKLHLHLIVWTFEIISWLQVFIDWVSHPHRSERPALPLASPPLEAPRTWLWPSAATPPRPHHLEKTRHSESPNLKSWSVDVEVIKLFL